MMPVFMSQWSFGVKGVTDLQALILWSTGHLAFNRQQPLPNVLCHPATWIAVREAIHSTLF